MKTLLVNTIFESKRIFIDEYNGEKLQCEIFIKNEIDIDIIGFKRVKKLGQIDKIYRKNKSNNNINIKSTCTVIGVSGRSYYKYFDKTKYWRKIENNELKQSIQSIYKENKWMILGLIIYLVQSV